ncbi:MAG TPA: rhomboid family intramembrane serine protease [Verrucomicrobiae bacterium]
MPESASKPTLSPPKSNGWVAWMYRCPVTFVFLIVYVLAYLTELVVNHSFRAQTGWFYGHFALSLPGLQHGWWWQLITYQLMHQGWLHLIFNGWVIFCFGEGLEPVLGRLRYTLLLLLSGVLGGLLQCLAAGLWPWYFGGGVVGASASAFGLVAAYAAMFPSFPLELLILYVIPVTISARTLLIGSLAVALVGFGWRIGNVAHAAHLGGMVAGYLFIRMDWCRWVFGMAKLPVRTELSSP